LLAASALLSIEHFPSGSRWGKTLFWVIFILGVLTRVSSAALVCGFVMVYSFLNTPSLKLLVKKYWTYISFLFVCTVILNGSTYLSHNFGDIMELKYEYAISDKHSLVPLSEMKTPSDSVKYKAVRRNLTTDSANINEEFLARVVVLGSLYDDFLSVAKWKATLQILADYIGRFWFIFLLLCIFMGVALYSTGKKADMIKKLLILHGLFWFTMAGLSVGVTEMVDRIFSPFLSTISFITLLVCFPLVFKNGRLKLILGFTFLLLILEGPAYFLLKEYSLQSEIQHKDFESLTSEIHEYSKKNVVIILGMERQLFSNKPFERSKNERYNNVMFPMLWYWTYRPYGQEKVMRQFGFNPLDYKAFCTFLQKNQGNVVIITNNFRAKLLVEYLQVIYHFNVRLVLLKEVPQLSNYSYYAVKVDS
jgi:hypothetical protein